MSDRHGNEQGEQDDAERQRWDVILAGYGWGSMDSLDAALLNFVETSVLDADDIIEKAKAVEVGLNQRKQTAAFEECWRPFHDSLNDNEDEVCESLIEGIKNNFPVVSRSNLDAAVSILDELGRTKDADALIDFAKNNSSDEFWTSDDPFHRGVKDDRIVD
jgi:hypothetical protein